MRVYQEISGLYLTQMYVDDFSCRLDFSCSIEDMQGLIFDLKSLVCMDSAHQDKLDRFIKLFEYVIEKKVDKKS